MTARRRAGDLAAEHQLRGHDASRERTAPWRPDHPHHLGPAPATRRDRRSPTDGRQPSLGEIPDLRTVMLRAGWRTAGRPDQLDGAVRRQVKPSAAAAALRSSSRHAKPVAPVTSAARRPLASWTASYPRNARWAASSVASESSERSTSRTADVFQIRSNRAQASRSARAVRRRPRRARASPARASTSQIADATTISCSTRTNRTAGAVASPNTSESSALVSKNALSVDPRAPAGRSARRR